MIAMGRRRRRGMRWRKMRYRIWGWCLSFYYFLRFGCGVQGVACTISSKGKERKEEVEKREDAVEGLGCKVSGLRIQVSGGWGLGFWVRVLGFGGLDLGFWVLGLGFQVSGFEVEGLG